MRLSASMTLNFNAMFLYVLAAPAFLIQHLGVSPQGFAWLFGPGVGGMVIGAFISGQLAGRLSPRRTIALGCVIMSLAAAANLIMNLLMPARLPWAILPFPFYNLGMAMAMPSMQLLALDLFPEKRGSLRASGADRHQRPHRRRAAFAAMDHAADTGIRHSGVLVLGLIVSRLRCTTTANLPENNAYP
jgi:DHA1 family bicyclomycin/chloramphenicol resistance-like MFS transporter